MKLIGLMSVCVLLLTGVTYAIDPESVVIYGHKDLEIELAKEEPRLDYIKNRLEQVERAKDKYGINGYQLSVGKHAQRYSDINMAAKQFLSVQSIIDKSVDNNEYCNKVEDVTLYGGGGYTYIKKNILGKIEMIFKSHGVDSQDEMIKDASELIVANAKVIEIAKSKGCKVYSYRNEFEILDFSSQDCLIDTIEEYKVQNPENNFDYQEAQMQMACITTEPLFTASVLIIDRQQNNTPINSDKEKQALTEVREYLNSL